MTSENLSEHLFGRRMRLPIALYVYNKPDGLVYLAEVAQATGYPASNVREELGRLVRAGMLLAFPQGRQDRRRYYQRINSRAWDVIRAAALVVQATPSTSVPLDSPNSHPSDPGDSAIGEA
jgi:hypothetical protein